MAPPHPHPHPAPDLHRLMGRLVLHQHRLQPGLRGQPGREDPGDLRAVLAVQLPRPDGPVRRPPEHPAQLRVAAVGLDRAQPAGRVLLRLLLQRRGHRGTHNRVYRDALFAGSAPAREPGHLVGSHPRDALLPRLVAHPAATGGPGPPSCASAPAGSPGSCSSPGPSSTTTPWNSCPTSSCASPCASASSSARHAPPWPAAPSAPPSCSTYVLAVLILFWYFYPILAGQVIPYTSWLAHMWYHGWI